MGRVAIDTGVIVEYLDLDGEFHEQAAAVFGALEAGGLEVVVPHPIMAETYYVAARLYGKLGLGDPDYLASELVGWLYRLPCAVVPGHDLALAVETGRAKARYGLALTDCYVLAASRLFECRALFRKAEAEMSRCIDDLRKDYRVVFLEEYV